VEYRSKWNKLFFIDIGKYQAKYISIPSLYFYTIFCLNFGEFVVKIVKK